MYTISNQIISDFSDAGVSVYFGVIGGASARIIESVVNNNCKFIPVLNEQAAGYAAHGYFLAHGKPAGIILTTGPGVTNAISGIASCFYDSIPLIVMMGQVKASLNLANTFSTEMHGFQELPHIDLVKPISNTALSIRSNKDYISQRMAIIHLIKQMKSVVSIEIQDDVQRFEIDKIEKINLSFPKKNFSSANKIKINTDLIVLGAGCRSSLSDKDFDSINLSKVPIVLSWGAQCLGSKLINSKGLFGTHTPGFGNHLIKKSLHPIVVGCSLLQHQIGKDPNLFMPKAKSIIFVNSSNNENERACVTFGKRILPYLSDAGEFFSRSDLQINGDLINLPMTPQSKEDFKVPHILSDIIEVFSEFGQTIFSDAGATLSWSYQGMNQKNNWKSGSKMYSSFNLHSMGFANCALVGSGVGSNSHSLAIIGDGSLPMNCQELAHLRKKPNLKIVVIDNKGYGIIRQTQDDYYNKNYLGSSFDGSAPLPKFSIENIIKAFGLSSKIINNDNYKIKELKDFFKGSDQVLIFQVDVNSKVVTDFYD